MKSTNDILEELRELSPVLAGMEKLNVFTVPAGYFDLLSEDILAGVRNEGNTDGDTGSGSIEEVPHGYFDSLAETIMGKIKSTQVETASEETRALSPMLYSIRNENVFEVPAGYFEELSNAVISRLTPQQAKIVVMKRRTTTFFKYAVAAAFTGVMALGVFKFTGPSKTELPDYVMAGLKIENIDQEFSKISDDEIVKYLEAEGSDVKAAIVANSVDENELPSQEEYLMDEKALDKYLNNINLGDLKN